MKKNRRSKSATERATRFIEKFEKHLFASTGRKELESAIPEDLRDFAQFCDKKKQNTKLYLWGIRYYYEFIANAEMSWLAGELREQRIKRASMALKEFPGVLSGDVEKLAATGIKNVKQLLRAGQSENERKKLAHETGIPLESISELVNLSSLTRISGIRGIRARLYHDAGVDTLQKLARRDPEELREMLIEFVERTKFDGIAPWPNEVRHSVAVAKKLVHGEGPSSKRD
ncbi:MAG: DUF4332 domain-containing protein [Candidatus Hodarchaeales archaeon]|jgi:hypothetical protein